MHKPQSTPSTHTIIIAGRKFHGVTQELTAKQDHFLIGHLRVAGCLDIIAGRGPGGAENGEARAEALLTQLFISGHASLVLAGCLTEEGQKWSVQSAQANAELFDSVTDSESKMAMRDALLGFVLGFFQSATASVATSRKSSSPS
jgi:hypothetical protein